MDNNNHTKISSKEWDDLDPTEESIKWENLGYKKKENLEIFNDF